MLHIGSQKYVERTKVTFVGDYEESLKEGRQVINICREGQEPKTMIITSDGMVFITFLSAWSIARRMGGKDNE